MGSSGQVSVGINVIAKGESIGLDKIKTDLAAINIEAKALNNRTLGNLNNKFNTLGTTAATAQRSIGAMNQEMQLVGGSAQQGAARTVAANRQIGTSYRTLAADATISSRMVNAGLNDTAIATRNVGMQVKSIGRAFTGAGIASAVAVAPIAIGLYAAAKQGIGLEDAVYKVGSAISATDKQYRQMEQTALNFSKVGRYSSQEVAGAMYELSSAGADYTQIMQALPGVVNLATATQADLGTSAKLLTSSLKQNGAGFDQASKYANVFTASANWSLGTVDKLSESLAYFGPVANTFGIGIEKQTAVLSGLYDRGIDASTAATGLRMGLIQLSKETPMHTEVLKKYGMTYADINPAMNDFYTVLGNIGKITDYTDIGKLVGAPSSTAWEVMSDPAVLAGVKEFEKRITGTNEAERTATEQMKSMQGSLFNLRGEMEQVSHDIYQQMKPAMMDLVGFMKDEMPGIGENLGTVFEGMVPGIKGGIESIKGMTEWFAKLDPNTLKMFGSAITQLAVAAPVLIGAGMVTRPFGDLIYGMSMITGRMADTRQINAYKDALCGVTRCATVGGGALPIMAGGLDSVGSAGSRNAKKIAGIGDEVLTATAITRGAGLGYYDDIGMGAAFDKSQKASRGSALSRLGGRMDSSFLGPAGSFALPLIGAAGAYMGWREMYDTNMYGQKDAWDSAALGASGVLNGLGSAFNFGLGSSTVTNKRGSYNIPAFIRGDEATRSANAQAFGQMDFGQQLNQLPSAFVGQGIPWLGGAISTLGKIPGVGLPFAGAGIAIDQFGAGFKSLSDEHTAQVTAKATDDGFKAAISTANTEKAILKMSEDRLVQEQGYTKEQAKLISGIQALNDNAESDIAARATNMANEELVKQGQLVKTGTDANGVDKYTLASGRDQTAVERQMRQLTDMYTRDVTAQRDSTRVVVGSEEELKQAQQDNTFATYELADSIKAQGVNFNYKDKVSEADIAKAEAAGIKSEADKNRYFKAVADAEHAAQMYKDITTGPNAVTDAKKIEEIVGDVTKRTAPLMSDFVTAGAAGIAKKAGDLIYSDINDTALSQWLNPNGTYKPPTSSDPANSPQNLMRQFFNSKKSAVGASPSSPGVASLDGFSDQEVKNMAAFMGVSEDKMSEFVSSGAMTEALIKPLAGAWGWGERSGDGTRGARAPGQGTVDQLMSAAKDQAREQWLDETYGRQQNYAGADYRASSEAEARQVTGAENLVETLNKLNNTVGQGVSSTAKGTLYQQKLAQALEQNSQFRAGMLSTGFDPKKEAASFASYLASAGSSSANSGDYFANAIAGMFGIMSINPETFNLASVMQGAAASAGLSNPGASLSGSNQLQTRSLKAQQDGVEVMGEVRDGVQELTRYTYDNATGELISQALRRDAEGNEEAAGDAQKTVVKTLDDVKGLTDEAQGVVNDMLQTVTGGSIRSTQVAVDTISAFGKEITRQVLNFNSDGTFSVNTETVNLETDKVTPVKNENFDSIQKMDNSGYVSDDIVDAAYNYVNKNQTAIERANTENQKRINQTLESDATAAMDTFKTSVEHLSVATEGGYKELTKFNSSLGTFTINFDPDKAGEPNKQTDYSLVDPKGGINMKGWKAMVDFLTEGKHTTALDQLQNLQTLSVPEDSKSVVGKLNDGVNMLPYSNMTYDQYQNQVFGRKYTKESILGTGTDDLESNGNILLQDSRFLQTNTGIGSVLNRGRHNIGTGLSDTSKPTNNIPGDTSGFTLNSQGLMVPIQRDNNRALSESTGLVHEFNRSLKDLSVDVESFIPQGRGGTSVNDSNFADKTRRIFEDPISDARNASEQLGADMSSTLSGVGPAVNSAIMSGIPESIKIPVDVVVNVSQTGSGGSVSGGYGGTNIRSTSGGSLHGGGYAH